MSSTARGYDRHKSDYYITPINQIELFLNEFVRLEGKFDGMILDPCSGGDTKNPMSYPNAFKSIGVNHIHTMDIREDSKADLIGDYLKHEMEYQPMYIITNPPFNIAREIIEKALNDVCKNGYVIMLLRLNYFGTDKRFDMWNNQMPKYCIVHHNRMSFTENGKTDSIEYAHFVWQKGHYPEFTKLKVI